MRSDELSFFVSHFLPAVPTCVVWLVGAVLALVFWRRHPGVSLLALLACLLLLGATLFGTTATWWILRQQFRGGWDHRTMGLALSVVNGARIVVAVVGYGLLLGAVFGWRSRPRPSVPAAEALPPLPATPPLPGIRTPGPGR